MSKDTGLAERRVTGWKGLLVVCLVAFSVTVAVHCLEFPNWNVDANKVDGEFIMGTHDAYHWLSGAVGVGYARDLPLSRFLAFASDLTGISVGLIGFWAPVIASGLAAVATVLWAWTLGFYEAGLVAGILAALSPGFYFRNRLGYCDTDMVTLLFPLLQAWFLAHWLKPHIIGRALPGGLAERLARPWQRHSPPTAGDDGGRRRCPTPVVVDGGGRPPGLEHESLARQHHALFQPAAVHGRARGPAVRAQGSEAPPALGAGRLLPVRLHGQGRDRRGPDHPVHGLFRKEVVRACRPENLGAAGGGRVRGPHHRHDAERFSMPWKGSSRPMPSPWSRRNRPKKRRAPGRPPRPTSSIPPSPRASSRPRTCPWWSRWSRYIPG